MKIKFYCENCHNDVPLDTDYCPYCKKLFFSVMCPICKYEGKAAEFARGCPACGYLKEHMIKIGKANRRSSVKKKNTRVLKTKRHEVILPTWVYRFTVAFLSLLLIFLIILIFTR
jgi:hypothetical protein